MLTDDMRLADATEMVLDHTQSTESFFFLSFQKLK